MQQILELGQLRIGEVATIERVEAPPVDARRLADLGFIRGATLQLLRRGRPCIARIDNQCIGLGTAHQRSIMLQRVPD